ncbi:aminotransferase class V-fold PLP-dependent enzyme [Streptomyces sp. ISL-94]|uniref:aminotransferase class V-fold PLP-dependent enzyme n=1 Tax=Streptomyces sp. ISL-94 TaxID=2819190 RepID=UPI001BEB6684|nr:aminotransferase class V-fold PLP-dependent enzyme [Streptomyces sp. ISL-94]MBT2479885.1 aminotransferase class V-fold PLP-dependent enzyme [Streptomyces sp. ISL-94]
MNAPTYHGERTAHLNTAGTGRMPDGVRAVLAECTALDDRFGPAALEESLGGVLHTEVHERLGGLLGVPAGDTVLAAGAAEAFEAFVCGTGLGPRDRIWTTPHEGVAHLTALHALRDRTRCRLEVVPLRADGDLDLDWMRAHLDEDVALVSVVHVSSACGTVNPVEDIGRLLAPHRARYAVDASHSVGRLPVDAARIGCHLLTADGWRFLRGPEGVGFAYAAPGTWDGLPQAPAPAAAAALNTALAHHTAAASLPYEDLLPRLRAVVERTPGMELLASGREQAGILAFRHGEIPAAAIRRGLARRGVVLWKTVAHENPLHPAGQDGATALRASVHHDNTAQDIDRFEQALAEVLREERHAAAVPAEGALAAVAAARAADFGRPSPYRARPVRRRGHLTLHRAT